LRQPELPTRTTIPRAASARPGLPRLHDDRLQPHAVRGTPAQGVPATSPTTASCTSTSGAEPPYCANGARRTPVATRRFSSTTVAVFDLGQFQPTCQTRLGDPEVLRDLCDRSLALAGDRDHVTTELLGERFRHDTHPSSKDRSPHRSGVNRTGGSPSSVRERTRRQRRQCVSWVLLMEPQRVDPSPGVATPICSYLPSGADSVGQAVLMLLVIRRR
jgi:hypothetical protein